MPQPHERHGVGLPGRVCATVTQRWLCLSPKCRGDPSASHPPCILKRIAERERPILDQQAGHASVIVCVTLHQLAFVNPAAAICISAPQRSSKSSKASTSASHLSEGPQTSHLQVSPARPPACQLSSPRGRKSPRRELARQAKQKLSHERYPLNDSHVSQASHGQRFMKPQRPAAHIPS